ncbi:hypothetical protein BDV93DRAFT_526656 [Ceratobasidium sp. AG-I]|nr:hypothetical protein BDV93DRAFT_526656 [Ceratobasidium sp. AG-I]
MSFSSAIRSKRQPSLGGLLHETLKYLRDKNVESAGGSLRRLVKEYSIPKSTLAAAGNETSSLGSSGLSIAALGARISLNENDLNSAAGFVNILNTNYDSVADRISPTTLHIISGFIEIASPESLAHAATILCSIPPKQVPPQLVGHFYKASRGHPDLAIKIWRHFGGSAFPIPSGVILVSILKRLSYLEEFSTSLEIIHTIFKRYASSTRVLPREIPLERAPQVITQVIRAGATQQSLDLWTIASRQLGGPRRPFTPEQALFFGDPAMVYALVRHFMKLAEKDRRKLQGWHRAQLEGNTEHFRQVAERVYDAFAMVHGFDQTEYDAYLQADHYHVTTSIACLFAINRFIPALDALNAFFRRNEVPDNYDLGIILSALARRNSGRAVQILLEIAPARIPGFKPTPYLYNIVLHQSVLQGKMDEAARVLYHARDAGCGSLEPKALDVLVRANLRLIRSSWEADNPKQSTPNQQSSSESPTPQSSKVERDRLFERITESLRLAGRSAHTSTVRQAIETAMLIRRPKIAWEIWMLAHQSGLVGGTSRGLDHKEEEKQDFGPASAWNIAKGLWSLQKRGLLDEVRMWQMVEALGVRLPEGVREGLKNWEAEDTRQAEPLPLPASFRSKTRSI